jgi:hypothetical protein
LLDVFFYLVSFLSQSDYDDQLVHPQWMMLFAM